MERTRAHPTARRPRPSQFLLESHAEKARRLQPPLRYAVPDRLRTTPHNRIHQRAAHALGQRFPPSLREANARTFPAPMPSKPATTIPEDRLAQALDADDDSGLRALPKADVHCHALLNCPRSTYEHVLRYKLPSPPPRFRDFGEFGGYLASNMFPAICSLDGIRTLLRAGLERMVGEGVVSAEASIALLLPSHIHAPARAGAWMCEGKSKSMLASAETTPSPTMRSSPARSRVRIPSRLHIAGNMFEAR